MSVMFSNAKILVSNNKELLFWITRGMFYSPDGYYFPLEDFDDALCKYVVPYIDTVSFANKFCYWCNVHEPEYPKALERVNKQWELCYYPINYSNKYSRCRRNGISNSQKQ